MSLVREGPGSIGGAFLGGGGAFILFQMATQIRKLKVTTRAIMNGVVSKNIISFIKKIYKNIAYFTLKNY